METFRHADSIVVTRSPEDLYDMVSDVTRMGEWSPVCKAAWWDEGDVPQVGAWFTGHNELPDHVWDARCEVVAAERGREFAFVVVGQMVWWSYTFDPVDGGTRVTESWEFLPKGIAWVREHHPDDTDAQIERRVVNARTGIAATLAAIRRAAEAQGG